MIDAFKDVLPGFLGFVAFFGLVAGLTWLFERCWRPRQREGGNGSVVSERATPPTRSSEPVAVPRPIPLYRGGYPGSPLPDPPYKAPKARATLPTPIDDAVVEFLYRDGHAERPKV